MTKALKMLDSVVAERDSIRKEGLFLIRKIRKSLGQVEKCLEEHNLFPVYLMDVKDDMSHLVYLYAKDAALSSLLNRFVVLTARKRAK